MITTLKSLKLEDILLISFPLFLLSGPFLTDLSIIIIDIIFLVKILKKEIILNLHKQIIYFFFFFFLTINATAFFSDKVIFYLLESLPFARFLIFPFALAYFLNKKIASKYKKILLIIFLALFIDSIFEVVTGKGLSGSLLVGNRPSSLFFDEHILGSYSIRLLSFLIPMIIIANQKFDETFSLICFLSILLIIMSKERVSILYLIIYLINICIVLYKMKINKNSIIKLIIVSILSSMLIYVIDGTNIQKRFNQTVNEMRGNDTYFDNEIILNKKYKIFDKYYIFSSTHHNYLLTSFNIFKNNHFFGAGVKSYRFECKKPENNINNDSCSTHPHNTYMQLLSEVGIFGTMPVLVLFMFSLIHYFKIFLNYRNKKNYLKNIFFILPIIISLFPLIPAGNIFNNYMASFYSFSLGIFIYYLTKIKKN